MRVLFAGMVAAVMLDAGMAADGRLTPAEREAAAAPDAVSVPTPAEFFAAIDKTGRPDWTSYYRAPLPTTYPSRAQIALNLGGLVADGFLAVEAQDGQQVKNIGKDIIALARALGVSQNILARGNSINDFAENNDWNSLKEEIEATQNEVKLAMQEQRDDGLVPLITLGAWFRGMDIGSRIVLLQYSPEAADLLRQPALVNHLRAEVTTLPDKLRADPLVEKIGAGLEEMAVIVAVPQGDALPRERVERFRAVVSDMDASITARTP